MYRKERKKKEKSLDVTTNALLYLRQMKERYPLPEGSHGSEENQERTRSIAFQCCSIRLYKRTGVIPKIRAILYQGGRERRCGNEERFKRHGYNPSSAEQVG